MCERFINALEGTAFLIHLFLCGGVRVIYVVSFR
jgi:hypothetical protein